MGFALTMAGFIASRRIGARERNSSSRRSQALGGDDLSAVERRAQRPRRARSHRTQPANHAPLDHRGHGIQFSGSGLSFERECRAADNRMQAWSPLQTSSSTPYFTVTRRAPRFIKEAIHGLMRRCLSS